MKCPKCAYLGFDTGERCRNCGYDFSLMPVPDPAGEVTLRGEESVGAAPAWLDVLDRGLAPASAVTPAAPAVGSPAVAQPSTIAPPMSFEPPVPPVSFRGEPALPLFGASRRGDDEPLITVPSAPRPPLSVRRTPDARMRAVPKAIERARESEPELDFAGERPAPAPVRAEARAVSGALETSGVARRLLAATVDHAILFAIDAAVVYLTLRIAQLTMSDWRALPILPMVTFLGLLKLSYFTAFTCVGGQTIGKMATSIRVVGDDDQPLDAPHAMHRALAGAVSFLILGAGFVPALLGSDRRALHDRLAHTRVVALPTA
jgi:uncharacterized RDD family membrane protein YckC